MIILYADRVGKQFFFWGENLAEMKIQGAPRGRKPKNPTAKPYLYDSSFKKLFSALELLLSSFSKKAWKISLLEGRRGFA